MERKPDLAEQVPGRIRAYRRKEVEIPAPKSQRELDAKNAYERILAKEEAKAEERALKREHTEMPFTLAFREVKESDFHFVLNAWLMSFRDSKRYLKNADYFAGQQNLIAEIASRRRCLLAVDADIPDFIIGFAAGKLLANKTFLLDYVYVKQPYRERGIATSLLQEMGAKDADQIIATHQTRAVQFTMRRKEIYYNPYYNMIGFSDV